MSRRARGDDAPPIIREKYGLVCTHGDVEWVVDGGWCGESFGGGSRRLRAQAQVLLYLYRWFSNWTNVVAMHVAGADGWQRGSRRCDNS
jgi:hypothetical protein